MNRNPVWLIFLLLIGLGAGVYSGYTLYEIYRFRHFPLRLQTESVVWSIVPLNDEAIAIQADYFYRFKDNLYFSVEIQKEHYLNSFTANAQVANLSKLQHPVWINPKNPIDSTLHKNFPVKQCISSLILWSIFAYFYYLGISYGTDNSRKSNL